MAVLPRAIRTLADFTFPRAGISTSRLRRRQALLAAAAVTGLAGGNIFAAPGIPISGNPPVAAPLGSPDSPNPSFLYDPATGDLTFTYGPSILSGTNYMAGMSINSTSGMLLVNNVSPAITSLESSVLKTGIGARVPSGPGISSGLDFGDILPRNLSAGALAVDLTLYYGITNSNRITHANLVYPGVTVLPTDVFIAAGGNWSVGNNWSLGRAPQTGDAVQVSSSSSGSLASFDPAASGIVLSSLSVNATGTASITLAQAQGALSVNGQEIIGDNGSGTVLLSGGTHTIAGNLLLGKTAGANGAYTISGGTLKVVGSEVIGSTGSGSVSQFGGSHIAGSLVLGQGAGSTGTYMLNSGTLRVTGTETIGGAGSGVFNQTGGLQNVGSLYLQPAAGASATLNMGGGSSIAGTAIFGSYGTTTVNLFGGLFTISNSEDFTVSGTTGTSVFNQSGGTHTTGYLYAQPRTTFNLSGGVLNVGEIDPEGIFNDSGGVINGLHEVNLSGQFNLSGTGTRTISGLVRNNGTVTATKTIVQFTGPFYHYGTYISQQADNYFSFFFAISAASTGSASITAGAGDRFFFLGDFSESGTIIPTFNVAGAEFHFSGGTSHLYSALGVLGPSPIPILTVDAGNTLKLIGGAAATIANFGTVTTNTAINFGAPSNTISILTGSGNLTVNSMPLYVGVLSQNAAVINKSGRLVLGPGTQVATSTLSSLAVNAGGTLDVNRSSLIVNYGTNATPLPQVQTWVAGGRGSNGLWNGTGITSAFVATNATHYGVAYTDGSERIVTDLTPGQLLIRPALYGDVNFDGAVNQTDINQITSRGHYNDGTNNHTWVDGDMNADGFVNIADIRIITLSGNYQGTYTPSAARVARALSSNSRMPAFQYNPATGDVTLQTNGTANIADLHLRSAGGLFLPSNSTFSGFSTQMANELENVLLGSSFANGFDLGNILPAGLAVASVQADVTATYGVSGGGVEQPASVVPEPASSIAIIGTAMTMTAVRRRRREKRRH